MADRELLIDNASRRFAVPGAAPFVALDQVSLRCPSGSFTALIGPSGCGKSTLLRLLAGLDQPDGGRLLIGGEPPVSLQRRGRLGIAFQDAALLPWRSVVENIRLPLDITGSTTPADPQRIAALIELVGLQGFERALDQILRRSMNLELQRIWLERPTTTLLVTHGVDEALFLADRVAVMQSGPGRISQIIDVPFARPRPLSLFATPAFRDLEDHVAEVLYGRAAGLERAVDAPVS